ncbi:hypothetical protein J0H58_39415 [bacterium]|nr:hypothetical protein [bacterium]
MAAERPDHTLDATAPVHEAYLRPVGPAGPRVYHDRQHFFTATATAGGGP